MKKYQEPVIDVTILTTDVLCQSPATTFSEGDYIHDDIFFTGGAN